MKKEVIMEAVLILLLLITLGIASAGGSIVPTRLIVLSGCDEQPGMLHPVREM
jgi:hypothetical protein